MQRSQISHCPLPRPPAWVSHSCIPSLHPFGTAAFCPVPREKGREKGEDPGVRRALEAPQPQGVQERNGFLGEEGHYRTGTRPAVLPRSCSGPERAGAEGPNLRARGFPRQRCLRGPPVLAVLSLWWQGALGGHQNCTGRSRSNAFLPLLLVTVCTFVPKALPPPRLARDTSGSSARLTRLHSSSLSFSHHVPLISYHFLSYLFLRLWLIPKPPPIPLTSASVLLNVSGDVRFGHHATC